MARLSGVCLGTPSSADRNDRSLASLPHVTTTPTQLRIPRFANSDWLADPWNECAAGGGAGDGDFGVKWWNGLVVTRSGAVLASARAPSNDKTNKHRTSLMWLML